MNPMLIASAAKVGGDLLGGFLGSKNQRKEAQRNRRFQREVLQNQLQWRVADAQAAGLHPLAALGAGWAHGQSVGSVGDPMGNAIADAGRGIANYAQKKYEREAQQAVFDQQRRESEARIAESKSRANLANAQAYKLTTENEPISLVKSRDYSALSSNDKMERINTPDRIIVLPDGKEVIRRGPTGQQRQDQHGEILGELLTLGDEVEPFRRLLESYLRLGRTKLRKFRRSLERNYQYRY